MGFSQSKELLKGEIDPAGYHLNPDMEFTRGLVKSLIINEPDATIEHVPAVSHQEADMMTWIPSAPVITGILTLMIMIHAIVSCMYPKL